LLNRLLLKPSFITRYFCLNLSIGILINSWISGLLASQPVEAAAAIACRLPAHAIRQKENLRQSAMGGNREAQNRYLAIVAQHARQLQTCRQRNWPRNLAIWLRLYPCDIRAGSLEKILDAIASKGYNQVYVEVFYNSRVLLPQADNPTPWQSVVKARGAERVDLLAQTIQKGRQRGLKVYAWLYTMNFGSTYAQRTDRKSVVARNGLGQDNSSGSYDAGLEEESVRGYEAKAFVDPYNALARADYRKLVQSVARRRPDGILFDYVRYPRSMGNASIAARVQDLWIYGNASVQTLYRRAANNRGKELIYRYLTQGYITVDDISQINAMYPDEGEPLWQERNLNATRNLFLPAQRQPILQQQLWRLTVTHAVVGILEFLEAANRIPQQQRIRTGAVFFPDGNRAVGQGYDCRLQPWDQFPRSMEWHPMVYRACGSPNCILSELRQVLTLAPPGTQIKPALAGVWGRSVGNRPPLEVQMRAIWQAAPRIQTVSHFAFSWQEPGSDRDRRACQLR
jgi:hypothetical protein